MSETGKSKVYEALERFQGLAMHGGNALDQQAYGYLSVWVEALLAAPRPLPDFPAGAPGPWGIAPDGLDTTIYDANGDSRVETNPSFLNTDQSSIRDFILSRVNAPARPAAVGLTDNEIRDCIYVGVRAAGWQAEPVPSEVEFASAAIAHAESLLSSRATGAEVEPTVDDLKAIRDEIYKGYLSDKSDQMVYLIVVSVFAEWDEIRARRHATMRGGGE